MKLNELQNLKLVKTNQGEAYEGDTNIIINGKEQQVKIRITCENDHDEYEFGDAISEDEKAKLQEKLRTGQAMNACIVCRATCNGIEDFDSLGGCYIENHQDVADFVNDYGLIDVALEELNKKIKDTLESFGCEFNGRPISEPEYKTATGFTVHDILKRNSSLTKEQALEKLKSLEKELDGLSICEGNDLIDDEVMPSIYFHVGNTYSIASLGDSNCVFQFEVVSRTEKTVTVRQKGEQRAVRRKITLDNKGVETIMPKGTYSMAPCLHAARDRDF